MKTRDSIIFEMIGEMPFTMPNACIPYVKEAMEIYAKSYHAAQLSAGIKAKASEFPTMDKTYWLVKGDELPGIDFGKKIEITIIVEGGEG